METSLGGRRSRFGDTLWTLVLDAKAGAPEALDALLRAYWRPVYAFVRRRGHNIEDAKDLAQGFFARALEKDVLRGVDPAKGKFKTFLLTLLERHLADERERASAKKRGGTKILVPLDVAAAERDLADVRAETPEQAWERSWAATVLARAFERLKETPYHDVLHLHLAEGLGVSAIARRLKRDAKAVENALGRGRARFREEALAVIRDYVASAADAEEELRLLVGRLR